MALDLKKILSKLNLVGRIKDDVAQDIAQSASLAVASALAQAPVLDALVDGKAVSLDLTVTMRFRVDGQELA